MVQLPLPVNAALGRCCNRAWPKRNSTRVRCAVCGARCCASRLTRSRRRPELRLRPAWALRCYAPRSRACGTSGVNARHRRCAAQAAALPRGRGGAEVAGKGNNAAATKVVRAAVATLCRASQRPQRGGELAMQLSDAFGVERGSAAPRALRQTTTRAAVEQQASATGATAAASTRRACWQAGGCCCRCRCAPHETAPGAALAAARGRQQQRQQRRRPAPRAAASKGGAECHRRAYHRVV